MIHLRPHKNLRPLVLALGLSTQYLQKFILGLYVYAEITFRPQLILSIVYRYQLYMYDCDKFQLKKKKSCFLSNKKNKYFHYTK